MRQGEYGTNGVFLINCGIQYKPGFATYSMQIVNFLLLPGGDQQGHGGDKRGHEYSLHCACADAAREHHDEEEGRHLELKRSRQQGANKGLGGAGGNVVGQLDKKGFYI